MTFRCKHLSTRLRHAWAVLRGRILLPAQIEEMILMAELTKTVASIAALSDAATRLINLNQSNAAALADAQATIASADDTTSQQIDAVTAKINAVAPETAPDAPVAVEAPAPAIDPATGLPVV